MGNLRDRAYPYVLGLLTAIVLFEFGIEFPREDIGSLLSAAVSFAAIVIGFLATAQTIMAGYINNPNTPAGRVFSVDKYRRKLGSYMLESFVILTIFAVVNIAGFFIPAILRGQVLLSVWAFFGVAGVLTFLRLYIITTKVITSKQV